MFFQMAMTKLRRSSRTSRRKTRARPQRRPKSRSRIRGRGSTSRSTTTRKKRVSKCGGFETRICYIAYFSARKAILTIQRQINNPNGSENERDRVDGVDVAQEIRGTMQQPSMLLPGPAVSGCCLVSFRFLCDIHSIHSVFFMNDDLSLNKKRRVKRIE